MHPTHPHLLLLPPIALAVVIAASAVCVASVAHGESGACPGGVRISGSPELARALQARVELPPRSDGGCDDVVIERDGDGLRLTLRRGDREVSRAVQDVRMASLWLSTWLVPSASASVVEAAASEAGDPPKEERGVTPALERRAASRAPVMAPWAAALEGRVGLDGSAGAWGGGDLSVLGAVTGRVCLGGALGVAWAQEGSAEVPWDDFHASLRGGGWVDLQRWRLRALLGVGLFTGAVGQDGRKTLDSGAFGEGVVQASYALSGSWGLVGGLGTRVAFSSKLNRWNNESGSVQQVPLLTMSMNLGVVFAFGGEE